MGLGFRASGLGFSKALVPASKQEMSLGLRRACNEHVGGPSEFVFEGFGPKCPLFLQV